MTEFNPEATAQQDESLAIAASMAEIQNEIAALELSIEATQNEQKANLLAMEEARRQFEDAQRKAKALENSMFDVKRAIREKQRAKESAERQLKVALDNKALREQYAATQDMYDTLIQKIETYAAAMPHQVEGAKRMAYAERAILADTMGLGKTLTSLITADLHGVKRLLIVAPNTVVRSFESEIKRWAPHRTLVSLAGITRNERRFVARMLERTDEFTVTVNYEAWRKDMEFLDILTKAKFEMVILDEAHNIKDINSIAFRGVEKLVYAENLHPSEIPAERDGDFFAGCSVRYLLPMTGTPILNKPQEIFPLLHLCDKQTFYREYQFLNDYCMKDYDTGRWTFQPGGMERLTKRISSRFLRRTKESAGIKLPPKTINYMDLDLDPEVYPNQYRACQELNKYAAIMLDDERALTVSAMIALITRKRQAITWPAGIEIKDTNKDSPNYGNVLLKVDIEESIKVDAAMDIIDEVISDEKVVLFSQFKAPLREMAKRIQAAGYTVATIDGDTPVDERADIIDRFQNKPIHAPDGIDIILGNYKAMGVGVTLTAATQMVILDEEWNPGKNEQAWDRIHRIGQDRPVTINVLRVKNSIDTWMGAINDEKAAMVDGFIANADMQQRLRDEILGGML